MSKKIRQPIIKGDHAELILTQGKIALIDLADIARVCQWNWSVVKTVTKSREIYYARRNENGKCLFLHRFILNYSGSLLVDHQNGDGLDCRKRNLRIATKGQNRVNTQEKSIGFRGVRVNRSKQRLFEANITFNQKRMRIGVFATAEEAARAYDAKAKEFFGDFAKLNFAQ